MNATDPTVQRWRVRAAGVDARVLCAGPQTTAEAVVAVHGNPGSCEDWEGLASVLGKRHRVVAPELPDFGQTRAPDGFDHSVPTYADYLAAVLDELLVERVHLVVHDFGGPIGLAWAAAHAQHLLSVTLIDTGVLPGYRWHRMARLWRRPVVGEVLQAATSRRGFRLVLGRGEPRGLPRAFLDRMYDDYDRRTRRAVLRLYRATDDPSTQAADISARLAPRSLPALVLWGARDRYLPAAFAWRQREAFPAAEVHVLADSGHWPFIDSAQAVHGLVSDFLVRAGGGATRAAGVEQPPRQADARAQSAQVPHMTSWA